MQDLNEYYLYVLIKINFHILSNKSYLYYQNGDYLNT